MVSSFFRPNVRLRPAPPGGFAKTLQPFGGLEIEQQEVSGGDCGFWHAGQEAMRADAAGICGLRYGDGTLPCEHDVEHQIIGDDLEQFLGSDLCPRQHWLVKVPRPKERTPSSGYAPSG